eukprot:514261-Amorphochlora_amoeboformis.AAC.2
MIFLANSEAAELRYLGETAGGLSLKGRASPLGLIRLRGGAKRGVGKKSKPKEPRATAPTTTEPKKPLVSVSEEERAPKLEKQVIKKEGIVASSKEVYDILAGLQSSGGPGFMGGGFRNPNKTEEHLAFLKMINTNKSITIIDAFPFDINPDPALIVSRKSAEEPGAGI